MRIMHGRLRCCGRTLRAAMVQLGRGVVSTPQEWVPEWTAPGRDTWGVVCNEPRSRWRSAAVGGLVAPGQAMGSNHGWHGLGVGSRLQLHAMLCNVL